MLRPGGLGGIGAEGGDLAGLDEEIDVGVELRAGIDDASAANQESHPSTPSECR
jgi:hypothetical protein